MQNGLRSAGIFPPVSYFEKFQGAGKMPALRKAARRSACASRAGCIILRALRLHSPGGAASSGEAK